MPETNNEKELYQTEAENVEAGGSRENDEKELYQTEAENVEAGDIDQIITDTEEKSLYELTTLKEANNAENDKIINDAQAQIRKIFSDLRDWLKQNSEPETIKQNLENAKEQTMRVLENARNKVIEVSNSDEFKNTVEAGKDFLKGTGGLIAQGFKDLKDELEKNPTMKKIFDNTDEQIEKLRTNENLKGAVDKVHEVGTKIGDAIFDSINSFFKPHEETKNDENNGDSTNQQ
ncbi:hypothetical protein [Dubosiella newyorkensis]|uniref:hypothetical protein n=1 Tax=Dubosiella newyorkensis TaxID=1862672 RepID=UPI00272AE376|nr:hypothetical protein [Dubosiella newyorkensis]